MMPLAFAALVVLSKASDIDCQGILDAWCSDDLQGRCNIPCASGQKLYAIRDLGAKSHGHGNKKEWRCYAANNTNTDHTHYSGGVCYCNREQQLADLICSCNKTSCAPTPSPVPTPPSTIIFKANDTIKSCYRNPVIIQTSTGDLLCFIEERYRGDEWTPTSGSHSCPDNYGSWAPKGGHNLGFSRSTDGGKTWAPIVRLAGNLTNLRGKDGVDFTNNAVVKVAMSDGRERLLWQYGTQNNPSKNHYGRILQRTSDDDGLTWSTPPSDLTYAGKDVGFPGATPGPGVGVQLPGSGRLAFCAWGNNSSDPFASGSWGNATNFANLLTYSDDYGKTWKATAPIGGRGWNECFLALLPGVAATSSGSGAGNYTVLEISRRVKPDASVKPQFAYPANTYGFVQYTSDFTQRTPVATLDPAVKTPVCEGENARTISS
jgi:hypothetical protein